MLLSIAFALVSTQAKETFEVTWSDTLGLVTREVNVSVNFDEAKEVCQSELFSNLTEFNASHIWNDTDAFGLDSFTKPGKFAWIGLSTFGSGSGSTVWRWNESGDGLDRNNWAETAMIDRSASEIDLCAAVNLSGPPFAWHSFQCSDTAVEYSLCDRPRHLASDDWTLVSDPRISVAFEKANEYCHSEFGTALFSVHSSNISRELAGFFQRYHTSDSAWIGLGKYANSTGVFRNIDGSHFDYHNFDTTKPPNYVDSSEWQYAFQWYDECATLNSSHSDLGYFRRKDCYYNKVNSFFCSAKNESEMRAMYPQPLLEDVMSFGNDSIEIICDSAYECSNLFIDQSELNASVPTLNIICAGNFSCGTSQFGEVGTLV